MADNKKKTSLAAETLAENTLNDKNASQIAKELAASVLSQTGDGKQTGAELEDKASRVLNSSKYSGDTKSLAGSVLSQSSKKR